MTAARAREIADEHIVFWRRQYPFSRYQRITAGQAWGVISPARYPGGGWESVRALMVDWLLWQDAAVVKREA